MKEPRSAAVTIVAVFLFAATAMAVVVGFALLFPGRLLRSLAALNPHGMAAFELLGRFSGVLMLGFAAVTAAGALGLLRRKRWAWLLAIVLFAVSACGDLAAAFGTREWLRSLSGFAVSSAFLWALCRPAVSGYFGGFRRTKDRTRPVLPR